MGGFFNTIKFIKDLLFPIQCIGCFKFDEVLCKECFYKLELNDCYYCPVCKKEQNSIGVCKKCRGFLEIDGLLVLAKYNNLMKELIHKYKYNNVREIEDIIRKIINKAFSKNFKDKTFEIFSNGILAPIPLHRKRYVERGFNQSEEIAKIISEILQLNIDTKLIKRNKNTEYQSMQSNKKQRISNIQNSFKIIKKKLPKTVILIDDVYTTGSTMNECAKTLKQSGAEKVYGIVIARG